MSPFETERGLYYTSYFVSVFKLVLSSVKTQLAERPIIDFGCKVNPGGLIQARVFWNIAGSSPGLDLIHFVLVKCSSIP